MSILPAKRKACMLLSGMEFTHHYVSPLGGITLASDGEALTGLWFDGQKYYADTLNLRHKEKGLPVFDEADRWLAIYFSGKEPAFTPKLRMKTTAFRKAVWEVLLTIPFGQIMTYGEIAAVLAKQKGVPHMSAQAVGGAVGHNAISLIIPCHRVVGAKGSLTGYAAGIDKKVKLLEMEKADMEKLFLP
jgi:methylated-DNA-[protein]-cysteine S-methyltransferase